MAAYVRMNVNFSYVYSEAWSDADNGNYQLLPLDSENLTGIDIDAVSTFVGTVTTAVNTVFEDYPDTSYSEVKWTPDSKTIFGLATRIVILNISGLVSDIFPTVGNGLYTDLLTGLGGVSNLVEKGTATDALTIIEMWSA